MNVKLQLKEYFSRNIGLMTEDEQNRLFETKIAIAGAGGVGGIHLLTLARLGVGNFHIADPDVFETVNISRQYGASVKTFGKNKAEVMAEMLKDINPYITIKTFPEKIHEENINSFLDGIDIVIDSIDFFEIETRRLLFRKAREKGIYALTSAPLGFGATLQVFSFDGMSFDEYFGISDEMDLLEKLASFAVGLAPRPYHIRYIDMTKVSLKKKTGPAVAPACTLASSLIAIEIVKILTGKEKVKPAPHFLQIDLLKGKFKRGYLFMGGKNPLQKLKKFLLLRKAHSLK